MKVFYFENRDVLIRANSSAGGLFTVLAELFIDKGGIVYGASFNKTWHVVHSRVEHVEDIFAMRGSKYVFTNISECFGPIEDDLSGHRKVLFCGTPCQVASVRKRFGENEDLFLVEVVCHGAPQPKYWDLYLNELLQKCGKSREDISSINFRDKKHGWKNYSFCIEFKDGAKVVDKHQNNLYIQSFVYNYTLKSGCFKCPFKYPYSKADISIGDFWGIEALAPDLDNNLGTTIAIASTSRGRSILSDICIDLPLNIEQIAKYNPAIIEAPKYPQNIKEFESLVEHNGFCEAATKILKPIFRNRRPSLTARMKAYVWNIYSSLRN